MQKKDLEDPLKEEVSPTAIGMSRSTKEQMFEGGEGKPQEEP